MTELNYSNEQFTPARQTGLVIGMENILRSEFNNWFKTRKWWLNLLIWTLMFNGLLLLLLTALPSEQANLETSLQLFALFSWMGTSVGIIIIMQDSVVGEKLSGTAEWVLSKPVSRAGFILAKVIANGFSAFLTMNLLPNLTVYGLLVAWGFEVNFFRFLMGSFMLYLNLCFFLTLTVLSGSVFNSRTPVIALPIAFLFGQQFASGIDIALFHFIPYAIANAVQPGTPLLITYILGEQLWSIWPLAWTGLWSVIFVALAIIRFDREEF